MTHPENLTAFQRRILQRRRELQEANQKLLEKIAAIRQTLNKPQNPLKYR